jgi:hypothetical protein
MYGEYETAEKRSMAETTTKRQGEKRRDKTSWNKLIGILQFYFILLRLFCLVFFCKQKKTDLFASGGKLAFDAILEAFLKIQRTHTHSRWQYNWYKKEAIDVLAAPKARKHMFYDATRHINAVTGRLIIENFSAK